MIPLPSALLLIGHPVSHSLSPIFQNAALRHAGIPLEYVAVDVPPDRVRATIAEIRDQRVAGNVTVPHKRAMFDACDALTPTAERAWAVNAFKVEGDGVLLGHNTDVGGVAHAVRMLIGDPRDRIVTIIGAGGAAAAVLAAAAAWQTEVRLRSRDYDVARTLAARTLPDAHVFRRAGDAVEGAHLVINATTLGMSPDDELPCEIDDLDPEAVLLDLVYRREETRWVREARNRGHRAGDGIEMLIEQGALSFEWWLGIAPDRAVMRASLPQR